MLVNNVIQWVFIEIKLDVFQKVKLKMKILEQYL